ncbi:polysaccharide biosynthesis tyrosine autokinase [Cognatishimia sp. MH4019]|uniref:GumC family protein n=1 Tax=Cognatishimia sp. MH4019 TaxID=2854030 RepID=UPI001CD4BDC8|nr:polysaccharide biosynthesis tyrosine autokinase [Cognatishimia sp. MH4019]
MTALPPGLAVPAKPGQTEDDVLDLGILLRALWRAKFRLCTAAFLGAVLALIWLQTLAQPLYRATAVVVMEPQVDKLGDLGSVLPGLPTDNTAVNTEVEVLSSRALLADVVDTLHLDRDIEFNPALRPPGVMDQGLAMAKALLGIPPAEPVRQSRTATLDTLSDALTVRNIPDSMVFELTTEASTPEKAALISNTLSKLYIRRQIDLKFTATEQATAWLSDRVAELKIELETAETDAKTFAAEMELINPETLELLSQQLKEVRERIFARETGIKRSGRSNVRDRAQLETLRQLEVDLAEKISRQSLDLVTLEQLQREATASSLIYEYFLSRLKETSVQQGIQQADSTILSPAEVPPGPARPRGVLIVVFSALLMGLISAMQVVRREALRQTFRTADEVEEFTGYTVLGQIPRVPARNRKTVLKYIASKPASAAVEAVRNLRTSVFMAGPTNPQIIMLTSSVPGEGKTTQALAMAQNMASLGKRVLVIEGDIRRRMFRSYFEMEDVPGMMSALTRKTRLEDSVWRSDLLGVDILPGDKTNSNAADIFSTPQFGRLLRGARKSYDVILIDTPPVLLVPDARVIGQHADAILYTVHWDKTPRRQVAAGLRSFQTVGLTVTGMVLSKVNPTLQKAYGHDESYDSKGYYHN